MQAGGVYACLRVKGGASVLRDFTLWTMPDMLGQAVVMAPLYTEKYVSAGFMGRVVDLQSAYCANQQWCQQCNRNDVW